MIHEMDQRHPQGNRPAYATVAEAPAIATWDSQNGSFAPVGNNQARHELSGGAQMPEKPLHFSPRASPSHLIEFDADGASDKFVLI